MATGSSLLCFPMSSLPESLSPEVPESPKSLPTRIISSDGKLLRTGINHGSHRAAHRGCALCSIVYPYNMVSYRIAIPTQIPI